MRLHQILDHAVQPDSRHIAVVDPERDADITYAGLHQLIDRIEDIIAMAQPMPGDRIGLCIPKSIATIASIFATLRAGGAYVPVDPTAPTSRNAYIFSDCQIRLLITTPTHLDALRPAFNDLPLQMLGQLKANEAAGVELCIVELYPSSEAPASAIGTDWRTDPLAYILYTSGSTGKPKGVMISHQNAVSFIDWCSSVLHPVPADRFSSHAPVHFDLSILDIFVSLKHGATLVLIGEETSKQPLRLAPLIAEQKITIWYSTPSILRLLLEFGKLSRLDFSSLRWVLFAGEVFPVKHLRSLRQLWPQPRYLNLYGPTETNVCTWYEVAEEIPEERTVPYPIGMGCSHCRTRIVDDEVNDVVEGLEGELVIAGASVMQGYWNLPSNTASAYFRLDDTPWYRTGDIVKAAPDGNLTYISRRDRMVKRRGYRVELGEIEAALYKHPSIAEAGVVAVPDESAGVHVRAFLGWTASTPPSIIDLKRFCSENLPSYMIPDSFTFQPQLPKTSTDKIDYQALKKMAAERP